MDVAVVLGTSTGSSSDTNFDAQKELVKGLLKKYDISQKKTLVSYISMDTVPFITSKLGDARDKNDALRILDSVINRKQTTSMDNVLTFINDTVFSSERGARLGVPKSILYFVDTDQTGDKRAISQLAQKQRAANVKLVIVGQGGSVNKEDLTPVAYDEKSVFFPPDMKEIWKYVNPVSVALQPGNF